MTNKLTDEQRENIRKLVYAPQKDFGRGLMVQFVSTRDAARLLLSSEQAWKEAAEQAIEVLQYVSEVCLDKRCLKAANDFLSSLNKEETT